MDLRGAVRARAEELMRERAAQRTQAPPATTASQPHVDVETDFYFQEEESEEDGAANSDLDDSLIVVLDISLGEGRGSAKLPLHRHWYGSAPRRLETVLSHLLRVLLFQ